MQEFLIVTMVLSLVFAIGEFATRKYAWMRFLLYLSLSITFMGSMYYLFIGGSFIYPIVSFTVNLACVLVTFLYLRGDFIRWLFTYFILLGGEGILLGTIYLLR